MRAIAVTSCGAHDFKLVFHGEYVPQVGFGMFPSGQVGPIEIGVMQPKCIFVPAWHVPITDDGALVNTEIDCQEKPFTVLEGKVQVSYVAKVFSLIPKPGAFTKNESAVLYRFAYGPTASLKKNKFPEPFCSSCVLAKDEQT